jgi:hypothetical protein
LLGHPLNNSLVTGFLTLFFVIIAEGTTRKFFFLGLGIMAIFAFGGRTALAAVILTFPFILYFDLKNYDSEEAAGKFFNYLFLFIVMLSLCAFVLVATPFGERIFASSKFDDDSADVRARVFDMFRHFSPGDLMLGIEESKILRVMYLEKVDIIENFWIIWIFKYGILLSAMLAVFLVRFLLSLFHNLGSPTRYILLFVFFLVASGNNSMATNTTAGCYYYHGGAGWLSMPILIQTKKTCYMKKISIVIPVYNRKADLPRCLESTQSPYENYEVIAVDDGSTDGSYELLQTMEIKNLKVLKNPGNRGVNYTRNRGIEQATGDYVLFLDSDDKLMPDGFDTVVKYLNENPGVRTFSFFCF